MLIRSIVEDFVNSQESPGHARVLVKTESRAESQASIVFTFDADTPGRAPILRRAVAVGATNSTERQSTWFCWSRS